MINLTYKTRIEHDINLQIDADIVLSVDFDNRKLSYKKKCTNVPHICRLAD